MSNLRNNTQSFRLLNKISLINLLSKGVVYASCNYDWSSEIKYDEKT